MKFSVNSPCPCGTGNKYKKCCQPFHKGKLPQNALELMCSRYSAYSLNLAKYIIKTTHPLNIDFQKDAVSWEKDILEFSKNYTFEKLTIIEFIESEPTSFVTFRAQITCEGNDHTFCEKSSFEKINNSWMYLNAIIR